jgi:nitroimidazol reductase NimA-like FMN-containing flavoprotein (pyridoxamine 5'-phosphate oxidase superfamily)
MSDSHVRASRPGPAGYFMDAESGSGLLPWSHVVERMTAARNYWVATSSSDGRPHAMPVWGVWLDDALVFSTSPVSQKARNIDETGRAAVHLESGDDVVVVEGDAAEVRDEATLVRFLDHYNPKYEWDFTLEQVRRGVYVVRPRKAFAWRGSSGESFSGTATRWIVDQANGRG